MKAEAWIALVAAIAAVASAGIASWQAVVAHKAAVAAGAEAAKATAAVERGAAAQESIAAMTSASQDAAASRQANLVRIRASGAGPQGRKRVRIENGSSEPIFDVQIEEIASLIDGVESTVSWKPNPYTTPVLRAISRIDGGADSELFPMIEDLPGHAQWSVVVRFTDSAKCPWLVDLAGNVTRADVERGG